MLIVDVTAGLDGVTVDGENEQLSPDGRPEQLNQMGDPPALPGWQ
jgi:hypothetical protein